MENSKIKWSSGEKVAVAIIGSFIGVLMASFYGKTILNLLSGEWSGAVSGVSFSYHATPLSMFIGGAASAIVCLISMVWSARKILSRNQENFCNQVMRAYKMKPTVNYPKNGING